MIIEETPSGNLRMYAPPDRDAAVRFTRADVRSIADVFGLLDKWAREANETPALIDDAPSRA